MTSFIEKGGMTRTDELFEGRLWMKETVKSTLLRRKGELALHVVLTTIAALIGLVIGKLF